MCAVRPKNVMMKILKQHHSCKVHEKVKVYIPIIQNSVNGPNVYTDARKNSKKSCGNILASQKLLCGPCVY